MSEKKEIFISYSRTDGTVVYPLAERLKRYFRVFIDKNMHGGDPWPDILAQKVRACAGLVVFLSPEACNSDWVKKEINTAQAANRPIIPYRLAPCDIPSLLIANNYIDGWDSDAFGKLLDSLNEKAPLARHHPGMATDLHRSADARGRTFADTAQTVQGALRLDSLGDRPIVGLPIGFWRHHAFYLVGFGDETIERTDTLQVALQATGPFPGNDMPYDIARFVAARDASTPLRLLHIRGPLRHGDSHKYDYSTDYPEEWQEAVKAVYWAVTQTYDPQPRRVQVFIKAPAILALKAGLELAQLQRNVQFNLYHLDEDRKDDQGAKGVYTPVFEP